MRVLLAGWFSFENMGTTAGDLISKDIICDWLKDAGVSFDVALTLPFSEPSSVDWMQVDPLDYSDLMFVCGPFGNGWPVTEILDVFKHCRFTGINLSLLHRLSEWNPFDLLFERDHFNTSHPDITFYGKKRKVPVVGIVLAHKQKEYGKKSFHEYAHAAIDRLIQSREMSVVSIDTALEKNVGGLRTPHEVESLIAVMDVVVTTRLHGTVLSLKNDVPVIPIDPVAGGAKITLQVKTIGWPVLFNVDNIDEQGLKEALEFCLTDQAKAKAAECRKRALESIRLRKEQFVRDIQKFENRGIIQVS